jgi:hypothetical protein
MGGKPYGAPGWNRTSDPQLRRLIEYNSASPCFASGFPLYLCVAMIYEHDVYSIVSIDYGHFGAGLARK